MSIKTKQKQVDNWIHTYGGGYWTPLSIFANLVEEVGEVGRELNCVFGGKNKKSDEKINEIGMELADVIYNVICLANLLEIDLDEAFQKIMDKFNKRDKDRFKR